LITVDRHPKLPGLLSLKVKGSPEEFHRDLNRVKSLPGSYYDPELKIWVISHILAQDLYNRYGKQMDWKIPRHEVFGEPPPLVIPEFQIDALEEPYFHGDILDHQTLGASFLYYNKRVICGDDVGVGKTPISIRAALKGIYVHKDIKQVLVFTRASLKYQWATEIEKFTDCSYIVINGTKKQREKQWTQAFEKEKQFVICNWEQLLHSDFEYMKSKTWDLIIGDEAHLVANSTAERSKAFAKLKSDYMFLLTATPVNGKADRAYTLVNYLHKGVLGKKSDFERDYCIKDPRFGWANVGYKNMADLHFLIAPYIIQRAQSEVEGDLPTIITKDYYLEATPVQKRIMEKIAEKITETQEKLDAIDISKPDMKEEYERLSGLIQGCLALQIEVGNHPKLLSMSDSHFVRGFIEGELNLSKSPKLAELMSLLEDRVEAGHKVIVFTEFARMTEIIDETIRASKSKVLSKAETALLTGSMVKSCSQDSSLACNQCPSYNKCNTRRKSQWRFKNDDNCMIFISTSAGAEGLNLQNAKQLINYDLPWDPFKWDQRQGRIARLGATHKHIIVSNLVMQDTIDEAILKTHSKKRDVIDTLIANTAEEKEYFRELLEETKRLRKQVSR